METTTVQPPKFVRWALLLGIIVTLNIFFSVVLALAYPAPVYEDFCPVQPMVTPTDSVTCDAQGGIWATYPAGPTPSFTPLPAGQKTFSPEPQTSGYCDMYAKCRKPYQAASDTHALNAFMVMVAFGLVSLVAGFMPIGSSIVSSGLSYGGVVALIIGSASYWGTAGNWLRLAIITVGLITLIYIGWRRFRD